MLVMVIMFVNLRREYKNLTARKHREYIKEPQYI